MDRGAWWAAAHGVAQSRTRLKRLSSSSILLHRLKDIASSLSIHLLMILDSSYDLAIPFLGIYLEKKKKTETQVINTFVS